jgi:ABC-type lipoprotein release transport system permease subunit
VRSLLFQVDRYDPSSIAAAAGVLLLVAVGAAILPARRASRIAPMTALRHE